MIDYKIQTFLTLCKNMNYTLTAQELNMTQPAVTNHIKQLEKAYNCKLFDYSNRVLTKTKQAEILQNYAISAQYNNNKLHLQLMAKKTPILNIGATKTIGEYVISNKVLNLVKNEDIQLNLLVENTKKLLYKLKNNELDFIFVEGFYNKEEFDFDTYKVGKLIGICSVKHEFAEKTITVSDIIKQTVILREEGSGTREIFDRALQNHNYSIESLQKIHTTNSFRTITKLVKNDVGISFVYEDIFKKSENLKKFLIKGFSNNHSFDCVYLKNTTKSPYLKYFIN